MVNINYSYCSEQKWCCFRNARALHMSVSQKPNKVAVQWIRKRTSGKFGTSVIEEREECMGLWWRWEWRSAKGAGQRHENLFHELYAPVSGCGQTLSENVVSVQKKTRVDETGDAKKMGVGLRKGKEGGKEEFFL